MATYQLASYPITEKQICTPKISKNSTERLEFYIAMSDAVKLNRGRTWQATVTDIDTGKRYTLKGCACDFKGCFCDAYVVK